MFAELLLIISVVLAIVIVALIIVVVILSCVIFWNRREKIKREKIPNEDPDKNIELKASHRKNKFGYCKRNNIMPVHVVYFNLPSRSVAA